MLTREKINNLAKEHYTSILVVLLLGCLGPRLILAYSQVFEFTFDITTFQLWGYHAVEFGLGHVYESYRTLLIVPSELNSAAANLSALLPNVNYPPLYLSILWLLEMTRRFLFADLPLGSPAASLLFKLPGILGDLATLILIATIIKQKVNEQAALVVAAIYALHPTIFYISSGFGQVDSLYTFFIVLSVWALERKRFTFATVVFVVAGGLKFQAIAFAPLLIFLILRERSWKILGQTGLAGFITTLAITAPFIVTGRLGDVIHATLNAPGYYQVLSAYAFNLWWIVLVGMGLVGAGENSDQIRMIGIPLAVYGAFFYMAAIVASLKKNKSPNPDSVWLVASGLALAFFLFPTEMHERYLYPVFALLAIALPRNKSARLIFAILTLTFTLNYLWFLLRPWPVAINLLTGTVAIVNVTMFFLLLHSLRPTPATVRTL